MLSAASCSPRHFFKHISLRSSTSASDEYFEDDEKMKKQNSQQKIL